MNSRPAWPRGTQPQRGQVQFRAGRVHFVDRHRNKKKGSFIHRPCRRGTDSDGPAATARSTGTHIAAATASERGEIRSNLNLPLSELGGRRLRLDSDGPGAASRLCPVPHTYAPHLHPATGNGPGKRGRWANTAQQTAARDSPPGRRGAQCVLRSAVSSPPPPTVTVVTALCLCADRPPQAQCPESSP